MKINYRIYQPTLSKDQSRLFNRHKTNKLIWFEAYHNLTWRPTLDRLTSDIVTLDHFNMIKKGWNFTIDCDELSDLERMEMIFEAGNIGNNNAAIISAYRDTWAKSVSVGDIVVNSDYSAGWLCQSVGWAKLHNSKAESVLDYLNMRSGDSRHFFTDPAEFMEQINAAVPAGASKVFPAVYTSSASHIVEVKS